MTIDTFIKTNRLHLSTNVHQACKDAVVIMAKSHDSMHDIKHVESMLDSLHKFRQKSREVPWDKINFNILLLSICWHDVWKSQRIPSNRGKAVFHQLAEGLGSMRLFVKLTKKYKLDPHISKRVKYSIRKHSMFQIIPTKKTNYEARILQDLDKLDTWKPIRLARGITSLQKNGPITPALINLFKLYFKYHMLPRSKKANFAWTIQEMQSHKNDFFLQVKDLIIDLHGPKAGHDFFKLNQTKDPSLLKRFCTTVSRTFSG